MRGLVSVNRGTLWGTPIHRIGGRFPVPLFGAPIEPKRVDSGYPGVPTSSKSDPSQTVTSRLLVAGENQRRSNEETGRVVSERLGSGLIVDRDCEDDKTEDTHREGEP